MNGNLTQLEKTLRKIAKHSKSIKYTKGLLFAFLMTGMAAFSAETSSKDDEIDQAKDKINDTVKDLKEQFKIAREENDKLLRDSNMELIQLIEQGEQVIKSPWSSWQFGSEYTYDGYLNDGRAYRGRGDKEDEYIYKRGSFNSKYTRNTKNNTSGTVSLDLEDTYEDMSTSMINAGIKAKSINKQALNINLTKISQPSDPTINVVLASPISLPTISVVTPSVTVPTLNPNANPFSDFTWSWLSNGNDSAANTNPSSSANLPLTQNTDVSGGIFWSGVLQSGIISNTAGYNNAQQNTNVWSTPSFSGTSRTFDRRHLSIINSYNGRWTGLPGNTITGGTYYVAGNVNNIADGASATGTEVFHLVSDVTIKDVTAYLYGKAAFINAEAFRGGNTQMQNVTINVMADENTIFNIRGAGPGQDASSFSGGQFSTLFGGNANITVDTKSNTAYAVKDYAGGLRIENTGDIIFNGASNIGVSFLTWVPDKSKYIFQTFSGYTSGGASGEGSLDKYIPYVKLASNAPMKLYGDENTGIFFNSSQGSYNVGIHQGYFELYFNIGTQLNSNLSLTSQTSSGNISSKGYSDQNVDQSVGVYAISGQRTGVDVSGLSGYSFFSLDPIHNLNFDKFNISFGKYSKNGIMFLAKNGTVIDIQNTSSADFSDGINGTSTSEAESGLETIIAYSEGTWTSSGTGLTVLSGSGIIGKPTEIIINKELNMMSKKGIAFFAKDGGKITVNANAEAYGYGSLIAYADNGKVEINSNITAIDSGVSTTANKFNNVGSYAVNGGEITISGNSSINGLGALANGSSSKVDLNGTNNVINTGISGGLVAQTGGTVNFNGGTITNKDNIVNDHSDVTPFYAGGSSKVVFNGATTIDMYDGILVSGNASDYSASVGGSNKYQGMSNVNVVLQDNGVNFGIFDGVSLTWDDSLDSNNTYTNGLISIPQFKSVNTNGKTYLSSLKNGTLNITSPTITLDSSSDRYNYISMENELVTFSSGTLISGDVSTGSLKGQGLSLGSNSSATANTSSGYINNGTINVTGGTTSAGIAGMNVAYGQIHNTSTGNVTIDNGASLFATNGSKIVNDGVLTVTGSGQGIAAFGKDLAGSISYGNSSIYIENNGTMSVAGNNATGIYANNNGGALQTDVNIINNKFITLTGDKSVGIALVGGNGGNISLTRDVLNTTGLPDIKVSTNGVGVFAENSNINITTPYKIETKENGVGIFSTKSTTVTGTTLDYDYTGISTGLGIATVYKIGSGSTATNSLDINLNNITNTTGGMIGIFANDGGTLNNTGKIVGTTLGNEFGIVVENNGSTATNVNNSGDITLASAINTANANVGIYVKPSTIVPPTINAITNSANITTGNNTLGIYGYKVDNTSGTITTGDNSVGIYTQGGNIDSGKISVGGQESVAIFAIGNAQTITLNDTIAIGDTSYGIVNKGTNSTIISNVPSVNLGNDNVFIYSSDVNGNITNNTTISSTGNKNYGLYASGTLVNDANINMDSGVGNVGIYSLGTATNNSGRTISVGTSDPINKDFAIGMAAGYVDATTGAVTSGTITNYGTINVYKDGGIGMYANGSGSKAINWGDINLSGKNTIGMYLDNGATGVNYGHITALPNSTNDGITGMVALNNSIIKNYGQIVIDGPDGIGMYNTIGSSSDPYATDPTHTGTIATTNGAVATQTQVSSPTSKFVGGVSIIAPPNTPATIIRNGITVTPTLIDTNVAAPNPISSITVGSTQINLPSSLVPNVPTNAEVSQIDMYVDTSGINYTNPIKGLSYLTNLRKINLLIGTEAARYTNALDLEIGKNIFEPYNNELSTLAAVNLTINTMSASLTWIATPTLDVTGSKIEHLYLSKIPYSSFAKDQNTAEFMNGLDEMYKIASGNEKTIFNKLNDLGKGEGNILAQAVDQMKGNQYANIQSRASKSNRTLDKGFDDLLSWENKTKDSNKIKLIGGTNEFKTTTNGIIDYDNNNIGVVYLKEDETFNLGRTQGWYTGLNYDRYKFKDIGESTEDAVTTKVGIFKSVPFDNNNSLNYTIKADINAGMRQMHRKFLVVDEIFDAQSTYYTYGTSIKNELSKSLRISNGWTFKPYALLDLEYGRFTNIKEDKGTMKLDVKANDYYSVKPAIGAEISYKVKFARYSTFNLSLGGKYEQELGKIQDIQNATKIQGVTSNYSNLVRDVREEGAGIFNLDMGIDNSKLGLTLGTSYNTSREELLTNLGLRLIF